jgi:hypothetical protein
MQALFRQLRKGGGIPLEQQLPRGLPLRALIDLPAEQCQGGIGNHKRPLRIPTVSSLGQRDLGLAQRRPVCLCGVLLVRRSVPDVCAEFDQRWTPPLVLRRCKSALERGHVVSVSVNRLDEPTVCFIPFHNIF